MLFELVQGISPFFYFIHEINKFILSRDNPPLIKLESRLFGTLEKVHFEFLRLSLPISCHDKFIPK
jgi:hypothetical protein